MTIQELLELMQEIAELTYTRVCLGIQVSRDGSGRSSPGTIDDGIKISPCKFDPHSVKWDNASDGNEKLCKVLRNKLRQYRQMDSADTQLPICCHKFDH